MGHFKGFSPPETKSVIKRSRVRVPIGDMYSAATAAVAYWRWCSYTAEQFYAAHTYVVFYKMRPQRLSGAIRQTQII